MKLAVLALLTSCYSAPEYRHPDEAAATPIIYQLFEDAVGELERRPIIFWRPPKDDYPSGASWLCDHAFVEWDGVQPVSETALTHELAHCVAFELGNADADRLHEDPFIWPMLVGAANEELQRRNL